AIEAELKISAANKIISFMGLLLKGLRAYSIKLLCTF
ncbi:MAG: hypothetical protein ACJARO_000287, partial [Bacteriovoracaceae bacterium]